MPSNANSTASPARPFAGKPARSPAGTPARSHPRNPAGTPPRSPATSHGRSLVGAHGRSPAGTLARTGAVASRSATSDPSLSFTDKEIHDTPPGIAPAPVLRIHSVPSSSHRNSSTGLVHAILRRASDNSMEFALEEQASDEHGQDGTTKSKEQQFPPVVLRAQPGSKTCHAKFTIHDKDGKLMGKLKLVRSDTTCHVYTLDRQEEGEAGSDDDDDQDGHEEKKSVDDISTTVAWMINNHVPSTSKPGKQVVEPRRAKVVLTRIVKPASGGTAAPSNNGTKKPASIKSPLSSSNTKEKTDALLYLSEMTNRMFDGVSADSVEILKTRDGHKNKNGSVGLNSHGRGREPSSKDMQLIDVAAKEHQRGCTAFQMCKWENKIYHVDFKGPFTAFYAFGLALAQMDG